MQELKGFGLTKNEIKIYLTLLKLGTTNPSEIAKKTGFSRSYVYDALERLLEKEMVSTLLKNNKKNYSATSPKRLEELAKQRLQKIQDILPKLEDLQKSSKEEIKVKKEASSEKSKKPLQIQETKQEGLTSKEEEKETLKKVQQKEQTQEKQLENATEEERKTYKEK